MKIVIVHGQNHEGSTCHIARMLAEKLHGEVQEFFLPRQFGKFCTGCTTCFCKDETLCPHYKELRPLTEALNEADVIILASPVYVYHATGAMKAFLDHYGYRWMVHRPDARMFRKIGVCISTAAGAGMKSTNKDMADSLFFWGVPKIYKLGFSVQATGWEQITPKNKAKLERSTDQLAAKIIRCSGKVKPGIKTKAFFGMMRMVQKNGGWNPADHDYWEAKGWLGSARPWK